MTDGFHNDDYQNDFEDGLPEEQGSNEPVIGDAPPKAHTIFSNQAYGALWGFPETEKVVGSIVAVDLFLGALLQVSNAQFKNVPKQYDGTMYLKKDTNVLGDPVLKAGYAIDAPAEVVEKKTEVVFKVQEAPEDLM